MDSVISDELYQDRILPHVSRTFALTIPQLPPALRTAVTSAYLLCRIADTIEDEPALSAAETMAFLQGFRGAVSGSTEPVQLARELEPAVAGGANRSAAVTSTQLWQRRFWLAAT